MYGALRDKAVAEMATMLFPLADQLILTAPDNARAMPPEDIWAPGARITHSVAEAIALLDQAAPGDAIFITGSLYLAGEARDERLAMIADAFDARQENAKARAGYHALPVSIAVNSA